MTPPFSVVDGVGQVVLTAVHSGHDLRPEVDSRMAVEDAVRLREEDPFTDGLAEVAVPRVVVHRSRFEVDLNRPRDEAVYLSPEQAWGLTVWKRPPGEEVLARSLALYDQFYRAISHLLDEVAMRGAFVVLDIHSYNHRRAGRDQPPAPAIDNPDINLGTGSLQRARWAQLVDGLGADLAKRLPDTSVAENVRFRGGHLSHWINRRYAGAGCALALEFKKTFMDEWTGLLDVNAFDRLRGALAGATSGLCRRLGLR